MKEYWEKIEDKNKLERGMYIILPLKYDVSASFAFMSIMGKEPIKYRSSDFIELLVKKCSTEGDFVRRYRLDNIIDPIEIDSIKAGTMLSVTDIQMFVFSNRIAFLTTYLAFSNENVDPVYQFIYPGYMDDTNELKGAQDLFLLEIEEKILNRTSPKMHWFISDKESRGFILKEA